MAGDGARASRASEGMVNRTVLLLGGAYLGVGLYLYLSDRQKMLPGGDVAACRAKLKTMGGGVDPNDPRLCTGPSPIGILIWPVRFIPVPGYTG